MVLTIKSLQPIIIEVLHQNISVLNAIYVIIYATIFIILITLFRVISNVLH